MFWKIDNKKVEEIVKLIETGINNGWSYDKIREFLLEKYKEKEVKEGFKYANMNVEKFVKMLINGFKEVGLDDEEIIMRMVAKGYPEHILRKELKGGAKMVKKGIQDEEEMAEEEEEEEEEPEEEEEEARKPVKKIEKAITKTSQTLTSEQIISGFQNIEMRIQALEAAIFRLKSI